MTIALISRFTGNVAFYWHNVKEVLDNGTVIFENGEIDYIDDWFYSGWKKGTVILLLGGTRLVQLRPVGFRLVRYKAQ